MINFSADAAYGKTATAPQPPATPLITLLQQETRGVGRATVPQATTDLLDTPENWSWKQLRDYVLRAIAERQGAQPPGDEIRQQAIFRSFADRWGALAGPIARFAFEQQDGFWRSAPVTVTRFTKGADPYFAQPIAERLTA
ncbi:hypothetical protein [Streptomyces albidoflavus]|uniref:hypothetical protein n=1 Tax=Streptomyces albidoflavus TaxID=1886 RepID=UPI0033FFCE91